MKNHILKSPQYGNYQVFSPEGQLMFRCCQSKVDWYLKRNLAKVISENVVQLCFVPNGKGHSDDPFYLQVMENKCVVCGEKDDLTKHHVVPHSYRKHFPSEFKDYASHDVLSICVVCHHKYESKANELKQILVTTYNAPINGQGMKRDNNILYFKKIAIAILTYKGVMPVKRLQQLYDVIEIYLNKIPTDKDLEDLSKLNFDDFSEYKSHSRLVMEQITNIQEFVQLWRKHFLEEMNPQFMPQHWSVNRPLDKFRNHGIIEKNNLSL